MSLTLLIREAEESLQPIEVAFRRNVVWSRTPREMLARPPRYPQLDDYALVGTAFDFWLRALLAVEFDAPETETLLDAIPSIVNDPFAQMLTGGIEDTVILRNGKESVAEAVVRTINERNTAIALEEIYTDKFFLNCIDSARLEGIYRSAKLRAPAHPDVFEDLKAVARVAWKNRNLFKADSESYVLNPQYPYFGSKLGGCDADFAVGDLLVEVKTTTKPLPDLVGAQAVAYGHLDALEQQMVNAQPRWHRVGVYAARYGALGVASLELFEPHFETLHEALGFAVTS